MCSQVGDWESKKISLNLKLKQGKKEEEKLEYRIKKLRKARNNAKLQPYRGKVSTKNFFQKMSMEIKSERDSIKAQKIKIS